MSVKNDGRLSWGQPGPTEGRCQLASQGCSRKAEKVLSWKSWVRIGARYDKPGGHTGDTEVRNHVIIYSEGQRMWSGPAREYSQTQKRQPG